MLSVVLLSTTLSFAHHARCDFKIGSYRASCQTLRDEPSLQTFLFRHFFTKIRKIFTIRRKTRKLSKIRKAYAKNVRLDRYGLDPGEGGGLGGGGWGGGTHGESGIQPPGPATLKEDRALQVWGSSAVLN